jgi:hypothetical protein
MAFLKGETWVCPTKTASPATGVMSGEDEEMIIGFPQPKESFNVTI